MVERGERLEEMERVRRTGEGDKDGEREGIPERERWTLVEGEREEVGEE